VRLPSRLVSRLVRHTIFFLFVLSFFSPTIGKRSEPPGQIPGLGAAVGAISALFGTSNGDLALMITAFGVLANIFVLWALIALTFPQLEKKTPRAFLRAFAIISVVLASLPMFSIGLERLLVGYWCWLLAIGTAAVCVWVWDT
jgi:hypothetical protein